MHLDDGLDLQALRTRAGLALCSVQGTQRGASSYGCNERDIRESSHLVSDDGKHDDRDVSDL